MRIISYNVNGLRSAMSKGVLDWMGKINPDVVCLQEIKATPDQIPLFEIEMLGYHHYWFPALKKGYSGTAIFSKTKPEHVHIGMGIPQYDEEGRFIRADFGSLSVVSVYHPSGSSGDERQAFKMQWLADFHEYVRALRKQRPFLVLSGDFNICHQPIDIHDPIRNATVSGFLPEEREWMSAFLADGYVDTFRHLHKGASHQYTWWSYRANARAKNKGWRIDYHMISDNLLPKLKDARIFPEAVHSDHCPIYVEIDWQ